MVKRPGRDVDHLAASTADVMNECSLISAPPIYLHGVDRDFTFYGFFFSAHPGRFQDVTLVKACLCLSTALLFY